MKKMKGTYHKEVFDWGTGKWNIKKGDKVQVQIHPTLLRDAKLEDKEFYEMVLDKKRNFDRKIGTVQQTSPAEIGFVKVKFPNGKTETFDIIEVRTRGKRTGLI